MSRRGFLATGSLAAGGLVLGGTALSACSSSKQATSHNPRTGSLEYWYAPLDSKQSTKDAWVKYNVTAFEAKYPHIKIDAVPKNVDTIDKNIQVALAARRGPDMVVTPGPSSAIPYAKAGYLANLGPFYEHYGWKEKVLPWAVAAGAVGGKQVTIPTAYETLVQFYNKTLFEKHGWTPPTSRDELESLAKDMVSMGVIPFSAGNADYQPATEWFVGTFWNHHAGSQNVYNGLTGKLPWTDDVFVEPIELLKSYFDKGWIAGGVDRYFSNSDDRKLALFASGKAGMYISGTWDFQALPSYFGKGNDAEFDWAPVTPLNAGVPNDLMELSIGGTLSINAHSKYPDAAGTYLDWVLSDTKNMWAQVAAIGNPPTPLRFSESDIPSSIDPRFSRVYLTLQSATDAGHIGYTTWTFWGGKADTQITSTIDKVLTGDLSARDFCKGVDEAFKADHDRGLIPTAVAPGI